MREKGFAFIPILGLIVLVVIATGVFVFLKKGEVPKPKLSTEQNSTKQIEAQFETECGAKVADSENGWLLLEKENSSFHRL